MKAAISRIAISLLFLHILLVSPPIKGENSEKINNRIIDQYEKDINKMNSYLNKNNYSKIKCSRNNITYRMQHSNMHNEGIIVIASKECLFETRYDASANKLLGIFYEKPSKLSWSTNAKTFDKISDDPNEWSKLEAIARARDLIISLWGCFPENKLYKPSADWLHTCKRGDGRFVSGSWNVFLGW